MKTSELTGPALDWAVAKCEGVQNLNSSYTKGRGFCIRGGDLYNPSADWLQGGPIIERERIKVAPNLGGSWHGQMRHENKHPLVNKPVLAGWTNKHGPSPLIAAMRAYVASKLGDEVDIPAELID